MNALTCHVTKAEQYEICLDQDHINTVESKVTLTWKGSVIFDEEGLLILELASFFCDVAMSEEMLSDRDCATFEYHSLDFEEIIFTIKMSQNEATVCSPWFNTEHDIVISRAHLSTFLRQYINQLGIRFSGLVEYKNTKRRLL